MSSFLLQYFLPFFELQEWKDYFYIYSIAQILLIWGKLPHHGFWLPVKNHMQIDAESCKVHLLKSLAKK
jgi:hypothetical protein